MPNDERFFIKNKNFWVTINTEKFTNFWHENCVEKKKKKLIIKVPEKFCMETWAWKLPLEFPPLKNDYLGDDLSMVMVVTLQLTLIYHFFYSPVNNHPKEEVRWSFWDFDSQLELANKFSIQNGLIDDLTRWLNKPQKIINCSAYQQLDTLTCCQGRSPFLFTCCSPKQRFWWRRRRWCSKRGAHHRRLSFLPNCREDGVKFQTFFKKPSNLHHWSFMNRSTGVLLALERLKSSSNFSNDLLIELCFWRRPIWQIDVWTKSSELVRLNDSSRW